MRLADEIVHAAGTDSHCAGLITNIGREILRAERFELNDDVIAACENLNQLKPSSLLAAMPLCRLPYQKVWVEWRGSARVDREDNNGKVTPRKIGCLLEGIEGETQRCTGTWAWIHPETKGNSITVSPMGVIFDWNEQNKIDEDLRNTIDALKRSDAPAELKSRLGYLEAIYNRRTQRQNGQLAEEVRTIERWRRYATSPTEVAAVAELERHAEFLMSAHAFQFAAMLERKAPEEARNRFYRTWMEELTGEPSFIQAIIALLNSKNCVQHEREDLTQLNKARHKRGKKPLTNFVTTKIVLSRSQERAAIASGIDRRTARQHLVRGHFKVKRSGIYWWSPFLRGDPTSTVPRTEYRVSA